MDNVDIPDTQPVEIVETVELVMNTQEFQSPSNSKLPEIMITVLVAAIVFGGIGYFIFTMLKRRGVIKCDGMEKVPTEEDETEETKAEIA